MAVHHRGGDGEIGAETGEIRGDRAPGEGDERAGLSRPSDAGDQGELRPLLQRGRAIPRRLRRIRRPGTYTSSIDAVRVSFRTSPSSSSSSSPIAVVVFLFSSTLFFFLRGPCPPRRPWNARKRWESKFSWNFKNLK